MRSHRMRSLLAAGALSGLALCCKMEFGLAAVYTAAVALICLALKWIHDRNNTSVGGASSLLRVEANAAKMAGIVSAGLCAALLFVAVLTVFGMLVSDLLLAALDPRIAAVWRY